MLLLNDPIIHISQFSTIASEVIEVEFNAVIVNQTIPYTQAVLLYRASTVV